MYEATLQRLRAEADELRKQAHDAPMNRVHMDHTGRKTLGTHSTAYSRQAEAWIAKMAEIEAFDRRRPTETLAGKGGGNATD